jgi:hypothetical protein
MSFDPVELDFAVCALAQSLNLVSRGRERVLDRDLDVHVALVIGRLVADHDVLVGRNRQPSVDAIDGTVVVLRARRDDGNTHPIMWCWYFSSLSTSRRIAARRASDGSAFSKLICNGICMNSLSSRRVTESGKAPCDFHCPQPRSQRFPEKPRCARLADLWAELRVGSL